MGSRDFRLTFMIKDAVSRSSENLCRVFRNNSLNRLYSDTVNAGRVKVDIWMGEQNSCTAGKG